MFERLTGQVYKSPPDRLLVDVNGVGYGVESPLRTWISIENGTAICLWIHTHVREDAIKLFGFLEHQEREVFRMLISISGVGPKVGLSVLSALKISDLEKAISKRDLSVLESVSGIGKRLAEKLMVDLVAKWKVIPGSYAKSEDVSYVALRHDLISALTNLGYKEKDINTVLPKLQPLFHEKNDLSAILKVALIELGSRKWNQALKDESLGY